MVSEAKAGFRLNERLEADSEPVALLGLCSLRLMNDRRWPWLILVPIRPGLEEIHDLSPLDQAMLTFETNLVAQAFKQLTGCTKLNTGALGNVVRQLHIHVVARFEGDPGWPGPVWGYGKREPYDPSELRRMIDKVRAAL